MHEPRPYHRPRLLAVPLVLALVMVACGSGDPGTGVASLDATTATALPAAEEDVRSAEEAALAFTECLRDEGIDAPDPTFDADGGFQLNLRAIVGGGPGQEGGPREDVRAAMDACGEYLEDIRQGRAQPDLTQLQDDLLAFAECMRDNGIDMADPDITGSEPGAPGGDRGLFGELDPNDPDVAAAMEGCQELFGGIRLGGGPGRNNDEGTSN
jgi:hypothetical protein